MNKQQVTLNVASGGKVIAHCFTPKNTDAIDKVFIIAPAMGAAQAYYHDFASWLAEQGVAVLTFDYRGTGESFDKSASARQQNYSISDWIEYDCNLIIDYAKAQFPDCNVSWIGHSIGGQIFGAITNNHKISRLFTIASGTGYWRKQDKSLHAKILFFWYVLVPLVTPLAGYFPGKKLGIVGDFPKKAIYQWRRWCLNKQYLLGEHQTLQPIYQQLAADIVAVRIEDDELISKANFDQLHQFYASAKIQHLSLSPESYQEKRIGHLGLFKRKFKHSIWQHELLPALLADPDLT